MDTVVLKKDQVFIIHDKTYIIKKDTFFVLPETEHYSIKNSKGDLFYSHLEQSVAKRRWTRELHNIILPSPSKVNSDSIKASLAISQYVSYSGRPVRRISIKQLDVFGPTIYDTTRKSRSWIERTGNRMHFSTKPYLIRNNLLFKEGDLVVPEVLSDNERVLRSLSFFEDAMIRVYGAGALNDSVDIEVITKDVWSKAFNIQVNDIYSGKFQFWDRNIFGFAQELQNNIPWDSKRRETIGYEGLYKINNIAGSFINGNISYLNSFDTESVGLSVDKGFITPNTKYAGGFLVQNMKTETPFKRDSAFKDIPLKYYKYDSWIGRSFAINNRNNFTKLRQNFTIMARISHEHFSERPNITQNSYYQFQSKTLILGTVSFERQSFFKSNLIYNFGRTEDIPVGTQVQFTFGLEDNEFFRRKYLSHSVKFGKFLDNMGYAMTSVSIGGFLNKQNKPEQAVIQASINYFSNIFSYRLFNFRQFVNLSYTRGINRFSNEHLMINDENGIVGLKNDSVYGSRRFNMHWETVAFTPWYIYDFRFVLFAFADHTWIKNNEGALFGKWPYTGVGIGVRIRNERLVFNTIQIRFTIYPNLPTYSRSQFFELSGEPMLNPPSFSPKAPELLDYR